MKKRYARAKPIKKESEKEENKITKWDKVKPWLILAICEIILIFLCLIICWVYLQKGEKNELKNRTKDKNTRYVQRHKL